MFGALVAAAFATFLGADWNRPAMLVCNGSFGRFANGTLVEKPSRLRFIIDWQKPTVSTDGGLPGHILVYSQSQLDFEVRYDGYAAVYRINRIDGTIHQAVNIGGIFTGVCENKPFDTQF